MNFGVVSQKLWIFEVGCPIAAPNSGAIFISWNY